MMPITTLTDKITHDAAVARAEAGLPTMIHVSFEPSPVSRAFTPEYQKLAYEHASSKIEFCQMEYGKDTSALMKFGPQHMPIVIVMQGANCRLLLQPRIGEVRDLLVTYFGHK